MNTIAYPAESVPARRVRQMAGWLGARRRLVFGGLAVALLLSAATFGRPWLEAIGVGSAVISLLPCAAMCAAGLCMKGSGGCAKQGGTEASAGAEAPPRAAADA